MVLEEDGRPAIFTSTIVKDQPRAASCVHSLLHTWPGVSAGFASPPGCVPLRVSDAGGELCGVTAAEMVDPHSHPRFRVKDQPRAAVPRSRPGVAVGLASPRDARGPPLSAA